MSLIGRSAVIYAVDVVCDAATANSCHPEGFANFVVAPAKLAELMVLRIAVDRNARRA